VDLPYWSRPRFGTPGPAAAEKWDARPAFPVLHQAISFESLKGDIITTAKRKIEVFSAGCPACVDSIELVNRVACPSCEVSILDMNQDAVAQRAKELGIRSGPSFGVAGKNRNDA
jgi:hypothetical protein